MVLEKRITTSQIKTLLEKNMVDVIQGFKLKKGKSFDAKLTYDSAQKRITFV
ncbi:MULTISPECIES: topoisomerase C-terminal repeat-containing protein [Bacillus cereus group]|uniref:topoisomerase C-terminal repeat-containing protein n=1 Tax=Bacillus thuringiensis TaxID=1428 RepID=UPI00103C01CA|nr:DNA topoisomerase I [Bacillus sp. JAS24-2]TBX44248.1 DNA topoisomerase I [Bacillus thuringiensis]HDR4766541.1 topoisomerase C-terminal repeat-containing protein [Bacillus cereus]HDR4799449.1 topoisomerase C-terminal repeat-containing protein [Bacillus cereus]HDR4805493.1 topoisomerase C-terminal repeat-containing protein [Bacillus cereus]